MSANNTDMSKIKQVIRMMLQRNGGSHPSNKEIGRTVGLYKGMVNDYVRRIEADLLPVKELLEILYMNGDVTDGAPRERLRRLPRQLCQHLRGSICAPNASEHILNESI